MTPGAPAQRAAPPGLRAIPCAATVAAAAAARPTARSRGRVGRSTPAPRSRPRVQRLNGTTSSGEVTEPVV